MRVLGTLIVALLILKSTPGFADAASSCEGKIHPFRTCDAVYDARSESSSCQLREGPLGTIRSATGATIDQDLLERARAKRVRQLETNKNFALKTLQCSLTLQSSSTSSTQKQECSSRMEALKNRLRVLLPRVRQALFLSGMTMKISHPVPGSSPIPPITDEERGRADLRRKQDLRFFSMREPSFSERVKVPLKPDKLQAAYGDEYETLVAQAPFIVYFAQADVDQDSTGVALTDAISKWYVNLETERTRTLGLQDDQRLGLFRDSNLINEILAETKPALTKEVCDQAQKLLQRAETESRRNELFSAGIAVGGAGLCTLFPPSCPAGLTVTGLGSSYVHLKESQDRYQNVFAQFLNGTGCRGDLKRATDDRNIALLMIPLSISGAGGGAVRGVLKPQASAFRAEAEKLVERSEIAMRNAANVDELSTALKGMKSEIDKSVGKMTDKEIYDYLSGWVKSENEGAKYLPGLSKGTSPQSFDEMLKNLELGAGGKDQVGAVARTLYNNTAVVDQFDTFATMFDVDMLKGLLARETFESAVPGRVFQEFTRRVADEKWAWESVPVNISPAQVKRGLESWYDPSVGVWH